MTAYSKYLDGGLFGPIDGQQLLIDIYESHKEFDSQVSELSTAVHAERMMIPTFMQARVYPMFRDPSSRFPYGPATHPVLFPSFRFIEPHFCSKFSQLTLWVIEPGFDIKGGCWTQRGDTSDVHEVLVDHPRAQIEWLQYITRWIEMRLAQPMLLDTDLEKQSRELADEIKECAARWYYAWEPSSVAVLSS